MSYQYYTLTFVRFWITRIYDKGSIGVFIGRGGEPLSLQEGLHSRVRVVKREGQNNLLFLVQKPGVLVIKRQFLSYK